jgi:glycosyltransferase involved in cell wall biosynthesis
MSDFAPHPPEQATEHRDVDLRPSRADPVRVLRVIARMNVGGPAYHVSVLSGLLDPARFRTVLVAGSVGPGEASLSHLAARYGANTRHLPTLTPRIHPARDLRALGALVRIVRRLQPQIVHTHTAKAGMLGRVAAAIATRPRPLVVHTYHGHVLEGYFGPLSSWLYRGLERLLAHMSDCLIGVSQATVDDLVRLGVAPRAKFRVVRVGLDLDPFLTSGARDGFDVRSQAGVRPGEVVLGFAGRLVRIKRLDVLLRALAIARSQGVRARLLVVGDGPLRSNLELLSGSLGVASCTYFAGYRDDMPAVAAAIDVAVLSSDNEGTPVFLVESAAAGKPAVATRVGGVPEVVTSETGIVVPAGDEQRLAQALGTLATNPDLRVGMGERAREHVRGRFSSARLVADMTRLYTDLLDGSMIASGPREKSKRA